MRFASCNDLILSYPYSQLDNLGAAKTFEHQVPDSNMWVKTTVQNDRTTNVHK